MTSAIPKFPLVFYKATSGREPVRDWLAAPKADLDLALQRMKELQK